MMTRLRLQHILLGLMLTICCSQGVDYILPLPYGNEAVLAVAGETGGWCEVQSITEVNVKAYEHSIVPTAGFIETRTGIENGTTRVKANNAQIYSGDWSNVYSPLPISALGTKYIVSFCYLPTEPNYNSSIVITTHSYKTDVDITFRLEGHITYDNRTYTNGDTLTVSLQEYQTLTISSDWDLSGTVVRATQTVAVFSTMNFYDRVNHPLAVDQLLPVHLYGQEYVVAVDDNPSLYQIQIVSEASNTSITFNDGSKVITDETGIFKQIITSNTSLYFSSSRPVMTMLCKLDTDKGAFFKRVNFVVLRPVSLYNKQTSVFLRDSTHTLKILTDKQASDTAVKINATESLPLEWEEILGSRYKVGTAVYEGWSSAFITSSTSFTVLVFYQTDIYSEGYKFSQPTRQIGVEYILPLLDGFGEVWAVAGETGGWCEVKVISRVNVKTYESSTLIVPWHSAKGTGIENRTVIVKANNVQIYPYGRTYSPLPISSLGTKYIVSSCLPPGKSNYSSSIVITTHSYKTDVDITFRLEGNVTYENKTYTDGDTLTVNLQENQSLTITSDWNLSGTVVRATQTVVVFSTMNSYDRFGLPLAVSQLLPVHLYGQEYVVAVDDNPSLYQIQIVSEASNTSITFNDGSTVTMDESGIFKQYIESNTALHFSSSRPVMTMLCRMDMDKAASFKRVGFVVIQPVSLYTKQTSVLLRTHTLKIMTDKQVSGTTLKLRSTESPLLEWQEIPGSRYKVGTAVPPYDWESAFITSSTSFTVLVFNIDYVYTGGYNSSQPTREIVK